MRVLDCTTRILPDPVTVYRTEPVRDGFEKAHIPGACFVDMRTELSDPGHRYPFMRPSADAFADAVGRLGIGNDAQVVLYSTLDPWWATRAWWLFRSFGHEKVAVLDGGLGRWQAEGRRVQSGPDLRPDPVPFEAREVSGMFVDRDAVLNAIGDGRVCTVNARLPSNFAGIDGNNYGRPGRIPGSVNVPAASLYDATTGLMLPLETLGERFAAVRAGQRQVITYCGHGIAASAVAFALDMLGHEKVAIYDASLSEWAGDARLPLEVG